MASLAPTETLWDQFSRRATVLGAKVHNLDSAREAGEQIAAGGSSVAVLASAAAQSPDLARLLPGELGRDGTADDVVASARLAVAETGSLLLAGPRAERRAIFLAQRLWVLVPPARVLASLEAALIEISDLIAAGCPYVTLMSGPSRTADIERVLTIGVHGPMELHIVPLPLAGPEA